MLLYEDREPHQRIATLIGVVRHAVKISAHKSASSGSCWSAPHAASTIVSDEEVESGRACPFARKAPLDPGDMFWP